jgi:hypothetical protein
MALLTTVLPHPSFMRPQRSFAEHHHFLHFARCTAKGMFIFMPVRMHKQRYQ